jgi:hypothetical protein
MKSSVCCDDSDVLRQNQFLCDPSSIPTFVSQETLQLLDINIFPLKCTARLPIVTEPRKTYRHLSILTKPRKHRLRVGVYPPHLLHLVILSETFSWSIHSASIHRDLVAWEKSKVGRSRRSTPRLILFKLATDRKSHRFFRTKKGRLFSRITCEPISVGPHTYDRHVYVASDVTCLIVHLTWSSPFEGRTSIKRNDFVWRSGGWCLNAESPSIMG